MDQKISVVVIEDNPADVFLVTKAFQEAGLNCNVTSLDDGEEAIRFVRREGAHSHAAIPDLILLDLNLPKVDGEMILRAVREQSYLDDVPIVVWSSSQSPQNPAAIAALRVTRYITKPAGLEEFFSIGRIVKDLLFPAGPGTPHK